MMQPPLIPMSPATSINSCLLPWLNLGGEGFTLCSNSACVGLEWGGGHRGSSDGALG